MGISWEAFENDLVEYFQNYVSRNGDETAEFITNKYIQYVVGDGGDFMFKNNIVKYNRSVLENSLKSIFETAEKSNSYIFQITNCPRCSGNPICRTCGSNMLSQGVIGFWVGGKLGFLKPPPGSTNIMSNDVVFPGAPQILTIHMTTNFRQFAVDLTSFFRRHLLTVNGITISFIPTVGGPIPTPFPWQGYG